MVESEVKSERGVFGSGGRGPGASLGSLVFVGVVVIGGET